jgi:hypothetical protein
MKGKIKWSKWSEVVDPNTFTTKYVMKAKLLVHGHRVYNFGCQLLKEMVQDVHPSVDILDLHRQRTIFAAVRKFFEIQGS